LTEIPDFDNDVMRRQINDYIMEHMTKHHSLQNLRAMREKPCLLKVWSGMVTFNSNSL